MLIINVIIIGVVALEWPSRIRMPAHSINGQESKRKTTYSADVHRRAFNAASLWHSPCNAAATGIGTRTGTATASAHAPPAFASHSHSQSQSPSLWSVH